MFATGLIVLPDRSKDGEKEDFHDTKGFVKTWVSDYRAWQAKSPAWLLAGLAVGYTIAFMIARWAIGIALTVFSNPFIAGAAAMVIAAIIIGPGQIMRLVNTIKSSKVGSQHNSETRTETNGGEPDAKEDKPAA